VLCANRACFGKGQQRRKSATVKLRSARYGIAPFPPHRLWAADRWQAPCRSPSDLRFAENKGGKSLFRRGLTDFWLSFLGLNYPRNLFLCSITGHASHRLLASFDIWPHPTVKLCRLKWFYYPRLPIVRTRSKNQSPNPRSDTDFSGRAVSAALFC
jgi:hypothetical protein